MPRKKKETETKKDEIKVPPRSKEDPVVLPKAPIEVQQAAKEIETQTVDQEPQPKPVFNKPFKDENVIIYAEALLVEAYNRFMSQGKLIPSVAFSFAEVDLLLKTVKMARDRTNTANSYAFELQGLRLELEDIKTRMADVKEVVADGEK